jgi:uncharacterized membrane protein YhaH (DUF805 family)
MGDWRNYISFQGRLNRKPYWLMSLVLVGIGIVAFIVIGMFAAMLTVFWVLGVPLLIAFLWASMSIAARRLHDRNKSAWWLLLYQGLPMLLSLLRSLLELSGPASTGPANLLGLISFAITMWVLVDLGIMKGKPGPNRFGDDPLGPQVEEVFA